MLSNIKIKIWVKNLMSKKWILCPYQRAKFKHQRKVYKKNQNHCLRVHPQQTIWIVFHHPNFLLQSLPFQQCFAKLPFRTIYQLFPHTKPLLHGKEGHLTCSLLLLNILVANAINPSANYASLEPSCYNLSYKPRIQLGRSSLKKINESMDSVQTFLDPPSSPPKVWTPKQYNFFITRFKYTISVEYILVMNRGPRRRPISSVLTHQKSISPLPKIHFKKFGFWG